MEIKFLGRNKFALHVLVRKGKWYNPHSEKHVLPITFKSSGGEHGSVNRSLFNLCITDKLKDTKFSVFNLGNVLVIKDTAGKLLLREIMLNDMAMRSTEASMTIGESTICMDGLMSKTSVSVQECVDILDGIISREIIRIG